MARYKMQALMTPVALTTQYPGTKLADQIGLTAGTIVLTLRGEVAVQDLKPGDKVITRDTGTSVLTELRKRDIRVECIRIAAGSLGHNRPDKDMEVSPDAMIHVRDWRAKALAGAKHALLPAAQLVDGKYVTQQPARFEEVFELVFEDEHIIYADGVEMATAAA